MQARTPSPSNIPVSTTQFIGRESEIQEIISLITDPACRLLTLIGPGGIGKTRLAIEVASRKQGDFSDGVFFVPLQPLVTEKGIWAAIATTMKFQAYVAGEFAVEGAPTGLSDQLLEYLREKDTLLVMDNFEHVLQGAQIVAQILKAAPGIKVLVTSREALRLQEEWLRPVKGMRFPASDQIDNIASYSAVQLFIERARRVRSDLTLEASLPSVIHICRLVEGMPLALELASAWLKMLSCEEVESEIRNNVDILETQVQDIPERHRSIRAIFEYSWNRLSAAEQDGFMKISVFHEGCTYSAVQAVSETSLQTLSSLVDQSLLQSEPSGRLSQHELLRQYAQRYLENSGEADSVRDAHSTYYLELLRDSYVGITGQRQIETLKAIEADFENIRAAWYWAVDRNHYDAIATSIETVSLYGWLRARTSELGDLFSYAQEAFAPEGNAAPHPVWGRILVRNFFSAATEQEQRVWFKKALAIAREHDDRWEIALIQLFLRHDYGPVQTLRILEESLQTYRELGDRYKEAELLYYLSNYYGKQGNFERMFSHLQESIHISRAIGDHYHITWSEVTLMMVRAGKFIEAEQYLRESYAIAQKLGGYAAIFESGFNLSVFVEFGLYGHVDEARRLLDDLNQHVLFQANGLKERTYKAALAYGRALCAVVESDYDRASYDIREGLQASDGYKDLRWWYGYKDLRWWSQAGLACSRDDYATVKVCVENILNTSFLTLIALPFAAVIAADEGRLRQAVELLALAFTHPQGMTGWLEHWSLIARLRDNLRNELGGAMYDRAWERGKTLDWEAVANDILAEYTQPQGVLEQIMSANQALVDPLSERELEVLALIGAGHPNQEIADKLYVSLSTIKKHITHIYSKLDVDSRTQALIRAQELNLL